MVIYFTNLCIREKLQSSELMNNVNYKVIYLIEFNQNLLIFNYFVSIQCKYNLNAILINFNNHLIIH